MAVDKREIIQAAMQLERDGRQFYLDAAAKSPNALVKQTLTSLADDEANHLRWLENISSGGASGRQANQALFAKLKGIFAGLDPARVKEVLQGDDDLKAVRLAVELEEKSRAAYADWAGSAADEPVRDLCAALAEQEAYHRKLLENTIEYLERPADWFMQEEQWNFEGA